MTTSYRNICEDTTRILKGYASTGDTAGFGSSASIAKLIRFTIINTICFSVLLVSRTCTAAGETTVNRCHASTLNMVLQYMIIVCD